MPRAGRKTAERRPGGFARALPCPQAARPVQPLRAVSLRWCVIKLEPAQCVHATESSCERIGPTQIGRLLLAGHVVQPALSLVLGVPAELIDENSQMAARPELVKSAGQPVEVVEINSERTMRESH